MPSTSPMKDPRAAAPLPPVQRRTVTEEVLSRLRDLLFRGVLRPGARIDQAELAKSFGVSTVPVREALLRLQSAGLVEVVSHRGVFVSEVSVEELLDIYSTRELLEEQAARLAVQNLTSTDFDELERIANGMQAAANKEQLDEILTLNREFHFTIYRAAKRRHLLQLIQQLWDLSTRYAHLQLHTVPDRVSEALYEIRSIVSACRRKDADALGWMIRYKVHQTTAGLLQHMSLPDVSQVPVPVKGKLASPGERKDASPKKKTASGPRAPSAKKLVKKTPPKAPSKSGKKVAKKSQKKSVEKAARGKGVRKAAGKRGT